jgi:hypothetical protein
VNARFNFIYIICIVLCVFTLNVVSATGFERPDTQRISTIDNAAQYLRTLPPIGASSHWPNVSPELFKSNLEAYVATPLKTFEAKGTNFCSYTALSWLPMTYDPQGFIEFMVKLYTDGEATMGKILFRPSAEVKKAAGLLKYKGKLDINPATQIWYLSLADRFKGYLNTFDRKFDEGDENRLWAVTNFAKFNRMIRRLFVLNVRARGSDLIRPGNIKDMYLHLKERLGSGTVYLFLNNRLLYKKKHVVTRIGIPTHFVVLLEIYPAGDNYHIVYMDQGRKTLQEVSPRLLRKIVFGITHVKNE